MPVRIWWTVQCVFMPLSSTPTSSLLSTPSAHFVGTWFRWDTFAPLYCSCTAYMHAQVNFPFERMRIRIGANCCWPSQVRSHSHDTRSHRKSHTLKTICKAPVWSSFATMHWAAIDGVSPLPLSSPLWPVILVLMMMCNSAACLGAYSQNFQRMRRLQCQCSPHHAVALSQPVQL